MTRFFGRNEEDEEEGEEGDFLYAVIHQTFDGENYSLSHQPWKEIERTLNKVSVQEVNIHEICLKFFNKYFSSSGGSTHRQLYKETAPGAFKVQKSKFCSKNI